MTTRASRRVLGIKMPGGKVHDVLFIATMGNHVWTFGVSGDDIWKTPQLGTPFTPFETEAGASSQNPRVRHKH
jgi:hypothetical protein